MINGEGGTANFPSGLLPGLGGRENCNWVGAWIFVRNMSARHGRTLSPIGIGAWMNEIGMAQ